MTVRPTAIVLMCRTATRRKHQLPGLWFNASEIHALLMMQQLLEEVQPGLLGPHIAPLQTRLQSLLGSVSDAGQAGRAGRHRPAGSHPARPETPGRVAPLRVDRLHPAQAPAAEDPSLQSRPQRGKRARDLAAAPGALSRQLVSGRLVPSAPRLAQLCRGRHPQRRNPGCPAGGGRGRGARSGCWRQATASSQAAKPNGQG